ncbi:MAG: PilZ domain-containing protein [Caldimicrobium sp.]|nr:PilZ domain-containing protein [Caldimicrobium sp.]
MMDKRRFPRFFSNLKAYFPGDYIAYQVTNLSWKGLFISTEKNFPKDKRLIFLELELPDIGKIPIYGYIVHYGTPEEPGIGVEIVEIDQNLTPVWSIFIKTLNLLQEARTEYEKIKSQQKSEK